MPLYRYISYHSLRASLNKGKIFRHCLSGHKRDLENDPINIFLQEAENCEENRNCFKYRWHWSSWSMCILDEGAICGRGRRLRYKECIREGNSRDKVSQEICKKVRHSHCIPITTITFQIQLRYLFILIQNTSTSST